MSGYFDTAWNDHMNGGFAWKRTQLDYKNTPVNAPIIILALRLYQVEANERYLTTSQQTLEWMKKIFGTAGHTIRRRWYQS